MANWKLGISIHSIVGLLRYKSVNWWVAVNELGAYCPWFGLVCFHTRQKKQVHQNKSQHIMWQIFTSLMGSVISGLVHLISVQQGFLTFYTVHQIFCTTGAQSHCAPVFSAPWGTLGTVGKTLDKMSYEEAPGGTVDYFLFYIKLWRDIATPATA